MAVFLGVIVVGVLVMTVSYRFSASATLRRHVHSEDIAQANALALSLARFYAQNGSWEGVGAWLTAPPPAWADAMPSGTTGHGLTENSSEWLAARASVAIARRVVLLDASGQVIVDTGEESLGERHPFTHLQNGVPITVADRTVGTVVVGSMIEPVLNPADEEFLSSVNLSILMTSLAVGLLALVFGSLLFWQITSPLRALTRATEAIAGGELNQRVQVRSDDDIGRLARAFNQMAESLAHADLQRRHMLTDIAHELRTPLTIVQGNLEALLDGVYELTPENVAAVHRQTMVLSRLVADLRDLALAEAGQLQLETRPTSLSRIIASVRESLEEPAREKGIALKFCVAEALPLVQADEQRITQVLFNFLSNALRYTPTGGSITVTAEPHEGHVQVSVRDTGTGISPEDLPHVFERFYRGDHSHVRTAEGSGLGLAISKQIVEAHNGQIWAQSWAGAGSTFFFSLPLAADQAVPLESSPSALRNGSESLPQ